MKRRISRFDSTQHRSAPHPGQAARGIVDRAIRRLLLIDHLTDLFSRAAKTCRGADLFEALLAEFGIRYRISAEDAARIPPSGPAVVVANHPFGLADGLVLGAVLPRIRPDVKIVANSMLAELSELDGMLIHVDVFGKRSRVPANAGALKRAADWVRQGGLLAVFPAGEVSHLNLLERRIADPPWSPAGAAIARLGGATVAPAWFSGSNGPAFHALGLMHPRLRTVRLPRELLAMRGTNVELRVGRPVPPCALAAFPNDQDIARYLRDRTYELGGEVRPVHRHRRAPLAGQNPPAQITSEVENLPDEALLAEVNGFAVFHMHGNRCATLLREIGRLREVTFRAGGEGTGKPLDLDRFDNYYEHLVLWDLAEKRIAGAYRLASTLDVLPRFGSPGLYTTTLFRYQPEFFRRLGPALELGRSFVAPDYQKQYSALLALWRGIGAYVCRRPEHAVLFGPVSMSGDYRAESRRAVVEVLSSPRFRSVLAPHVEARNPVGGSAFRRPLEDLDQVSEAICGIEPDGKGLPVLLRQYLKLGGRTLGSNVDKAFSDVVDFLVLVDLRETPKPMVDRYLTREGARRFLDFHTSRYCPAV